MIIEPADFGGSGIVGSIECERAFVGTVGDIGYHSGNTRHVCCAARGPQIIEEKLCSIIIGRCRRIEQLSDSRDSGGISRSREDDASIRRRAKAESSELRSSARVDVLRSG